MGISLPLWCGGALAAIGHCQNNLFDSLTHSLFLSVSVSDVKKPFFLCWVEKNRYFSVFFPNFSGIFIISCIICISELPAKE